MIQLFGLARLGRDAEVRHPQGKSAVATLSLAFSYGKKGDGGKYPTQWVEASLWGTRAESLASHLVKGQQVAVTLDEVHLESFQARDGTPSQKLVGKVINLDFIGGRPEQSTQRPDPHPSSPQPPPRTGAHGLADMDDDIPY